MKVKGMETDYLHLWNINSVHIVRVYVFSAVAVYQYRT